MEATLTNLLSPSFRKERGEKVATSPSSFRKLLGEKWKRHPDPPFAPSPRALLPAPQYLRPLLSGPALSPFPACRAGHMEPISLVTLKSRRCARLPPWSPTRPPRLPGPCQSPLLSPGHLAGSQSPASEPNPPGVRSPALAQGGPKGTPASPARSADRAPAQHPRAPSGPGDREGRTKPGAGAGAG